MKQILSLLFLAVPIVLLAQSTNNPAVVHDGTGLVISPKVITFGSNVTMYGNVTISNVAVINTLTLTNSFWLRTNAPPVPIAGGVWLWNSNGALFGVSPDKTNLITDLRP